MGRRTFFPPRTDVIFLKQGCKQLSSISEKPCEHDDGYLEIVDERMLSFRNQGQICWIFRTADICLEIKCVYLPIPQVPTPPIHSIPSYFTHKSPWNIMVKHISSHERTVGFFKSTYHMLSQRTCEYFPKGSRDTKKKITYWPQSSQICTYT